MRCLRGHQKHPDDSPLGCVYCHIELLQRDENKLKALNAELLEALEDAIEDIEMWGAYASDYLKTKYCLAESLAEKRALVSKAKGELK
jgi:hypothetical protein